MCTEILLLQLASCRWPVFIMFSSFIFLVVSLTSIFFSLPIKSGRFLSLKSWASRAILSLVTSKVAQWALISLFLLLAYSNILGNVPGNYTPTQYYRVVMSVSLSFWSPIFLCAILTDFKGFFAHMFPMGAPIWMIILLPIVEFVSAMMRPLILVIRLTTNLAAGHILLFIFAYFASLLPPAAPLIGSLLGVLFVMEFFVSVLQAYIFVALLRLYVEDTVGPNQF